MKTFVITNPENGWNCVIGVYQAESEEAVMKDFILWSEGEEVENPREWFDERPYIVHESVLTIIL